MCTNVHMMTVRKIIIAAGGEQQVKALTGISDGIRHWQRIGIPMRHWGALIRTGKVTLDQIVEANRSVPRWAEMGLR
jgi:hypothetical protein